MLSFGPVHMSPCQQMFLVRYADGLNRVDDHGAFSQESRKFEWQVGEVARVGLWHIARSWTEVRYNRKKFSSRGELNQQNIAIKFYFYGSLRNGMLGQSFQF